MDPSQQVVAFYDCCSLLADRLEDVRVFLTFTENLDVLRNALKRIVKLLKKFNMKISS